MIKSALKTLSVQKTLTTSPKLTTIITLKSNHLVAVVQSFKMFSSIAATFVFGIWRTWHKCCIYGWKQIRHQKGKIWITCHYSRSKILPQNISDSSQSICWSQNNSEHLLTLAVCSSCYSPLLPSERRPVYICPLPTEQINTSHFQSFIV